MVARPRLGLGLQETAVFGADKSLRCIWAVWGNDGLGLRVATHVRDPFGDASDANRALEPNRAA